jgi:hypothetical protein
MKIKSNSLKLSGLELRKLIRSNLYHQTIYSNIQEDRGNPPVPQNFLFKSVMDHGEVMDDLSGRIAHRPYRTERLAIEGLNQIDMDEYELALMINKTL